MANDNITDFENTINSQSFHRAQDNLSKILKSCIKSTFKKKEPELVKEIIAQIKQSPATYGPVTLNAEFIHGNRYQVVFDGMRWKTSVELGDLLIISSINKANIPQFRRISFCQAKKNKRFWSIDQEQLFLLSNFPHFQFKNKLISQGTFHLRNDSACLGSHALFNEDNMLFISSKLLDIFMAPHKCNKPKECFGLNKNSCLFDFFSCFNHCLQKNHFFSNTVLCQDIEEFIKEWSLFNIGEWVYSVQAQDYPVDSEAANLYHEIINSLPEDKKKSLGLDDSKHKKTEGDSRKVDESIGIIHLVINVDKIID